MIFYFLISIVFIAEIIIALALILSLVKVDKLFINFNEFLSDVKPELKELLRTVRQISEKIAEAAPLIVKKVKSIVYNMIMGQIKSIVGGLTFFLVKTEVEKHI